MKNKFKLIAFDLDGTLLNFQMKISSFSRIKIIEMIKKNLKCVIISSRTLSDIKKIIGDIPFSYIAALNGAEIYDNIKHRVEKECFIKKELSKKILEDENIYGYSKDIYTKRNVFVTDFAKNFFVWLYQKKLKALKLKKIFFNSSFYEHIYQFDIIVNKRKDYEKDFRYITRKYSKGLSIKDAGFNFIILNNKKVDKGEALRYIAQKLKIKLKETIVVGDSPADLPMFNKECYKIAMKNGNKKIFPHADKVSIFKNHQNGAVKEILSIIE